MMSLTESIEAFQTNPNEETAQDINGAAMLEANTAFFRIPDGKQVPQDLISNLERACDVLQSKPNASTLNSHYQSLIRRRIDILIARQVNDRERLDQLLSIN